MKKKICVSVDGFPYGSNSEFSFVAELCAEMTRQGIDVTVISPQNLASSFLRWKPGTPTYYEYSVGEGLYVKVFRPWIITFGSRFPKLQYLLNSYAIQNVIKKNKLVFDAYYGHFWHCAYQLYSLARKQDKPLFVASGESHIFLADDYKTSQIREFLDYVQKVICVSSKNKDESVSLGFCEASNCVVLPNGFDNSKFYPASDKIALRKSFGISPDYFIVAFTGAFVERKGANRVSSAILNTNDASIKAIYIGKPQEGNADYSPKPETAIHVGYVAHDKIRDLLCCADVFVLPTYQEGCCNAIVEALACGLPVISSDRSFNYDILDESNSILIEPSNINEITDAILKLKTDLSLRSRLSKGAREKSMELSISGRASKILRNIFPND